MPLRQKRIFIMLKFVKRDWLRPEEDDWKLRVQHLLIDGKESVPVYGTLKPANKTVSIVAWEKGIYSDKLWETYAYSEYGYGGIPAKAEIRWIGPVEPEKVIGWNIQDKFE